MKIVKTHFTFALLLAWLSLAGFQVFGQAGYNITIGEEYKRVTGRQHEYISLGDGFMIKLTIEGQRIILQKFAANSMTEVARKTYEDFTDYSKYHFLTKIKDRLYLIYEGYNRSKKEFSVYSREINVGEASFNKERKLFSPSRPYKWLVEKQTFSFYKDEDHVQPYVGPRFYVIKSTDESKVAVYYKLRNEKRDDDLNFEELGCCVFDSEMNEIWHNEIKLHVSESNMHIVSSALTNKGELLTTYYNEKTNGYEILKIFEKERSVSPLNLPANVLFREVQWKENQEGELICVAYTMDVGAVNFKYMHTAWSFYYANGVVTYKIDPNGESFDATILEFDGNIVSKLLSKYRRTTSGQNDYRYKGIYGLNPIRFDINKDGSFYLLGEIHTNVSAESVYGDLFFTKFNPNGTIEVSKVISKFQKGSKYEKKGCLIVDKEKAYDLIFVDNPENISFEPDNIGSSNYNSVKPGMIVNCSIDLETGNLKKQKIIDFNNLHKKAKKFDFRMERVVQVTEDQFMLEINLGKKKGVLLKFSMN